MAENEALREALLELDAQRRREAELLRESNAVLAGIERMNAAATPALALDGLLQSISETLDCDGALILKVDAGDLVPTRVAGRVSLSRLVGAAATVLQKPRRVVDVACASWWRPRGAGDANADPVRSWVSVPLAAGSERIVLACVDRRRSHFGARVGHLLARLGSLVEQALSAEALAERNALLAAVIEGSSAAVTIADASRPDCPLIYVNRAFEEITGYRADDVIGRNCRFLSDEPPESPERDRLRATVREKGFGRFLLRNRQRDGTPFWNDLTLYPVSDPDGRVRYLVGTQVDATERRMVERERDKARDRLVTALSEIPEGFLLLDECDRVVFANDVYNAFYPTGGEAFRAGDSFAESYARYLAGTGAASEEAARRAGERLAAMRSGDSDHEERLADGRIVKVADRATPDGGLLSVVSDITEMRATERLLALRAAAIESAQDGISVADPGGNFIYMNPAYRRLFGIARDADVSSFSWRQLFTEEKIAWIEANVFPALRETGRWRGEIAGQRTDGGIVEQELTQTLIEGVGLISVTRDVSERRRGEMERARLIGQLSAAQRQEAISVIAAGIAHDLNNIVSVVTGSANLIAENPATGPVERRHARRIDQAGRSMADLIHRLLDFARRVPAKTEIDLCELVREGAELVRISLEKNVSLRVEAGEDPVRIPGDPTNLLQVILNLSINARDAIGHRQGTITLSARRFDTDTDRDPQAGQILAGEIRPGWSYGVIEVTDTGSGIEPQMFGRIVEPYYSTKGDAGTGLGLAVVAGIVQSMRGFLALRSTIGVGTTFAIFLPTTDVDLAAEEAVAQETALAGDIDLDGRLILVVDDDDAELEMIQRILERAGAEVASCQHPYDAVHTIQDDPDAWDLLITDFEMPDMSGAGLAAKVRGISPDLPILLYTARADWRESARPGDHKLFQREIIKPAKPGALIGAVAALLPSRQAEDDMVT